MLIIQFSGFFQCRLSTDSAPFDSKRGEGGWTIAFGNEPDLDRTIRFHNPAALRSHAPAIDVAVTSVSVDGQPQPAHPLIGGAVDMASDAVFEGRNGTIADASHEPISPMRIQVSAGRLVLSRDAQYDVTRPAQRGPFMGKGLVPLSDPMVRGVRLTSAADALAYRAARRAALTADLTQAPDANAATILQGRIDSLATQNDGAPVANAHVAGSLQARALGDPSL